MVKGITYRAEKRMGGSRGGIKNLMEHWYFDFLSQRKYQLKTSYRILVYTYDKIPHTYTLKKQVICKTLDLVSCTLP